MEPGTDTQVLAEMRRQTKALEGIHQAVMFWLALSILGVVLAVVYLVRVM